jgi:parvulin-like peptidyl-prolyl isomerase
MEHEHKHEHKKDHHEKGEKNHHDDHKSKTEEPKTPSVVTKLTSKAFLMPAAIAAIVVALALTAFFQGWIVAATVNGGAVSRHKVIQALEAQDGAIALEAMIEEKLLDQAIRKAKISVSQEEIAAEIATLTEQFASVGQDFDAVVEERGLTSAEVDEQIAKQLQLEALLSDETIVTDEEVDAFIEANQIEIPEDEDEAAALRSTVSDSIVQQGLRSASDVLLATLKEEADITYFVNYAK